MSARALYLGEWRCSGQTVRVANPVTGDAFAEVCTVTRRDVAEAIGSAHSALPAWRALATKVRGDFLLKFVEQVRPE